MNMKNKRIRIPGRGRRGGTASIRRAKINWDATDITEENSGSPESQNEIRQIQATQTYSREHAEHIYHVKQVLAPRVHLFPRV
jgi:hypothetical protein